MRCVSELFDQLVRRPPARDASLRAWDGADAVLLEEFELAVPDKRHALVVNDRFGALALPLAASRRPITSLGDSVVTALATAENATRLKITPPPAACGSASAISERFDAAIWRVPKSLALFEQQAAELPGLLNQGAVVLVGGMDRHTPPRATEIAATLGEITLIPRRRKARVFRLTVSGATPPAPGAISFAVPEFGLTLVSGSNVASRERLDNGARLLCEQLSQLPKVRRVADLGCGNGVIGIVAKRTQSGAVVTFIDESYQAIESARTNWIANVDPSLHEDAMFRADDCFTSETGDPYDLILCNPPFHQTHAIGDDVAWSMFAASHKMLRPGGELWIVGNRHLGYHAKLATLFTACRQVAESPSFVVLAATR